MTNFLYKSMCLYINYEDVIKVAICSTAIVERYVCTILILFRIILKSTKIHK